MTDFTTYRDTAIELGTEHGRGAGTWILDGNSSRETAQRLVAQCDDGDPAFWDNYRSPLSGEWADDWTPDTLMREIGWTTGTPEDWDEIVTAYEVAHGTAWAEEVERLARFHAA
jgi:hypothetical protein